jgi:hypothetical protein
MPMSRPEMSNAVAASSAPLRVDRRIYRVGHVRHDHLAGPQAPRHRPPGRRPEHPGQVPAGVLEVDPMAVERGDQPEVVQHGRHVQQLVVDAHPA